MRSCSYRLINVFAISLELEREFSSLSVKSVICLSRESDSWLMLAWAVHKLQVHWKPHDEDSLRRRCDRGM